MANLVNSDYTLNGVLNWLSGTFFSGGYLHLFLGSMPSFDNTTPLATFTTNEATFTGYINQAVSGWSTAYVGPYWQMTASTVSFSSTDVTPQTIYGWYFTDTGPFNVFAAELFTTPITIVSGGAPINIIPQYDSQSI